MKKITKIVTIIGIVSSILTNVHAETNELSQVTLDFIKIKLSKEELKKLNLLNESNEEYSSEKIKDNWERIYNYGFLNNVIDAQSFISEPDKNIILKLGNQKYLLESYNKFESENKEFLILDSKIPCLSSEETHLGVHLEISTSFQNNGVYILLSRQEIYIENYDELGFPKINNKEIQTNVFMTNDKPYLIHSYRIKDDFIFYFITSKKVKNKVVDKVKKLKNQVGFKFKKNDEDNEENDNETELLLNTTFVKIAKTDLINLIKSKNRGLKDIEVIETIKNPSENMINNIINNEKTIISESPELLINSENVEYRSESDSYFPDTWSGPQIELFNSELVFIKSSPQIADQTTLGFNLTVSKENIINDKFVNLNLSLLHYSFKEYDSSDYFITVKTKNKTETFKGKTKSPVFNKKRLEASFYMKHNELKVLNRTEEIENEISYIYYIFGKAQILK